MYMYMYDDTCAHLQLHENRIVKNFFFLPMGRAELAEGSIE
jgi:hypothetical protein